MIKEKILRLFPLYRVLALCMLILLIVLSSRGLLSAQAVTQGYNSAEGALQRGMLVGIKDSDTSTVEAVSSTHADKLHGVVVDANDAPVTLSAEDQKVFVATVGKYDVLVSDQNGIINPGDYITTSSLDGVGMRVDDQQPYVAGRALELFDGHNGVVSSTKVGDRTINVGRVRVDIQVARNPTQKSAASLPDFLGRAAEDIAGKPVEPPRIYMGLVIFFVSTAIAASLLFGGVKAGITSVGRNPLSKKSIIQGMLQVVIVGLTIFVSGIFGVYLLLKL